MGLIEVLKKKKLFHWKAQSSLGSLCENRNRKLSSTSLQILNTAYSYNLLNLEIEKAFPSL